MKYPKTGFVTALTLILSACGGGSGGNTPPSQAEVDKAIATLSDVLINDAGALKSFALCSAWLSQNPVGQGPEANCADGGTSQVTITKSECQEPPITINTAGSLMAQDCDDTSLATTVTGTIQSNIALNGDVFTGTISSNSVTINGLVYSFQSFSLTQDAAGVNTCSGTVTVEGFDCILNADCVTCDLVL